MSANRFAILDIEDSSAKKKKVEVTPVTTPAAAAPAAKPAAAPAAAAPKPAAKPADRPAGERRTGEGRPAGERRTGEGRPAGERRPAGEGRPPRPAGEGRPAGERPPRPAGERRPRDGDAGERRPRDSDAEGKPRAVREFRPRPPREAQVTEGGDSAAPTEGAPVHHEGSRGDRPNRGRGGRGRGDGTKREFDRRSGSGVERSTEKKHGHGKGNWGVAGQESTEATPTEATEATTAEATEAAPAETKEEVPTEPLPEEEEDKTMTLDEYKKAQAAATKFELLPARKPNEGSQDPKWKNTEVLQKEEEVYFVIQKEEKEVKKREPKQAVERIEITPIPLINDRAAPRRERGDRPERGERGERPERGERGERPERGERTGERGGRGGARGGRGAARGGARTGERTSRSAAPPRLDDASAFPTLGA